MGDKGTICVYLQYAGAHTTRWSGGGKINLQNLPRGSDLRRALMAPKGYLVATIDLSQIECRILNYVAREHDVLEAFRSGRDLYAEGASRFYGRPIEKGADPTERHLGKILELGCGYGMGPAKLQATCRAGALGGPPIILSDSESQLAIDVYRQSHPFVVDFWKQAGRIISRIAGGQPTEWGPVTIRDRCIILPNGAPIIYDTLEYSTEWDSWRVKKRNGWTKLYGGKLVENLIQALARVVFSQALIRIVDAGFKVVNLEHDKIAVLVKDDNDKYTNFEFLKEEMIREPSWLPGIPLACEGELNERYEPL